MKLHSPVIITARLQAGLRIGDAFISIDYHGSDPDGRTVYSYSIDLGSQSHEASDIKSGCQGGSLASGLESLLGFLGAAAESYRYNGLEMGGEDSNSRMFPEWVTEWAYQESDEISLLECELGENPGLIEE